MIDRRVRLVRELKGAPLSVWMALIFAGPKPVSQDWLIRTTGYSDKPVRQALAYLSEHGFIIRVQGGWLLSEAAMLLLPGAPLETAPPVETGAPEPPVEGHESETNVHIRNNSDSPASPPASPLNSEADGQIGKNSLPTRENLLNTSLFSDFPDPGAALQTFGIWQNRPPPGRVQTQHCAVQDPLINPPRSAAPRRQSPAGYQLLAHPSGRAQGGANYDT